MPEVTSPPLDRSAPKRPAARHPAVRRRPPRQGRTARRAPGGRGFAGVLTFLLVVGAGSVWAWWNGSVGSVPVREHCTATAGGTSTDLAPDQAANAATIAGIAVRRNLMARAGSIGIATAIQESKLRNIDYGDRDSLGLFQQRPSQGWGTPAQVMDPVYATNAFYDELVEIEDYGNLTITDVAQQVQRSAFPLAYADHEPEARILASALSGYSPAGFTCVLRPSSNEGVQLAGSDGYTRRALAVAEALQVQAPVRTVAPSGNGAELRVTASGSGDDRERRAWSVAHWALAQADALDVTQVRVADRVWNRGDSTDGWTTTGEQVDAGLVVIRVA